MFLGPHAGNLAKTDPLGMGPFCAKRSRYEASRREPLVNFSTTRGGIIDQYAVGGSVTIWYLVLFILSGRIPRDSYITQ